MKKTSLFSAFPYIRTDEITLRKIEKSDVDELFSIYNNENIFRFRPGEVRKNKSAVENMITHFERDFGKKKIIYLGICSNENAGRIIGVAEIFDFDEKVNMATIGYTLSENYWGQGYAAKTVNALCGFLFDTADINRIQAFVMPANVRSGNVLLKNGFLKEGTIRQGAFWTGRGVVDLDLYSLLKSDVI